MRESSRIVRIEKHRIADITALTFETAGPDEDGGNAASRPLVFVAHGLLSRKERHLELCLMLTDAGFLACTLDARFHGERATREGAAALGSSGLGMDFAAAFSQAVLGTTEDIARLADYLGRDRYGIIGHSMGGYIALKAAVTDPRAAVIVSISGNPDWTLLPDGARLPPIAEALARQESPITRADAFWPRPLLLLHGTMDRTVPIQGARALHSALTAGDYRDAPERLQLVEYPEAGHDFLPDMANRAVDWMRRFL